jgi:hypothetical protein
MTHLTLLSRETPVRADVLEAIFTVWKNMMIGLATGVPPSWINLANKDYPPDM